MSVSAGPQPGKIMHNRYRLIRSLGRGGMGALYLAGETIARLERRVVVKEMLDYYDPADPHGAERARKRFEDEAATLASLSIAGVPQIFDYFSEDGHNYIVMQYIEGRDLESGLTHLDEHDRTLPGRPYPIAQVRRWGVSLCHILAQLAGQGVVHMDIKPANLILDRANAIWLVDFGTARGKYTAPYVAQGQLHQPSIYGTPGYAPPEQHAGRPEPRSDVYALAATLYHLLTDDDPGAAQPPFAYLDQLPPDIAHALRLALARDVEQRLHAAEFGRLLETQPEAAAFVWRDGTHTYKPENLGVTADRRWDEALEYFRSGAWSRWFQELHRHDLDQALQATRASTLDPEMALDAFLRRLDPHLPPAQLHVAAPPANVGILPWRERRTLELTVENRGAGSLRAGFTHLPAGLHATPTEVTVHRSEIIHLVIDGEALSPRQKRQALPLTVDAGAAGQVHLNFQVLVPEPQIKLEHAAVDLGDARPNELLTTTLGLSNPGGSPLELSLYSPAAWLRVQPAVLTCPPGKTSTLKLAADTSGLPYDRYEVDLELHAHAGDWQRVARVPVRLRVSWLHAAVAALWLPLAWLIGVAVIGGAAGWLLGKVGENALSRVAGSGVMMVIGALLGMLLYGLPGIWLGWMGRLEGWSGGEGARRGFLIGLAPGLLAGGLAGLAVYRVWLWISSPFNPGIGLGAFGGLAGILIGASLGVVLYFVTRDA